MAPVDDCRQIGARGIRVIEIPVTPQAEGTIRVERQKLDIVGVVAGRSVAVLAFDPLVRRSAVTADIVLVTLRAGIASLVLDREFLPLIDIRQSIVVVRKAVPMNTEIIRYKKLSCQKNQPDKTDGNPQWVKYVPLHYLPRPW
jgi:hypothetical protein